VSRPTDYDALADRYDQRYRHTDYGGVEQAILDFAGAPPSRLLEVGCGTGHWLSRLRARRFAAVGADASVKMLTCAHARLPDALLVRATAEALPFSDGTFDRVLYVNALHHFADPACSFAEAHRVLRANGALMTIGLDPHAGTDRWCIYDFFAGTRARDLARFPAAAQIRDGLRHAGFTRCETRIAQHISERIDAGRALAEGRLDKGTTSQLADLTDDVYQRGLATIRRVIEEGAERGETVELEADLRLYATIAFA
jgi:ubiquinone/menaquinone biosynthesis C-methylase UbiE